MACAARVASTILSTDSASLVTTFVHRVLYLGRVGEFKQRFYKHVKITQLSIFAYTVHLAARELKIVNNGVTSRYPSRYLVYNVVDSGLAAAEYEWAWLATNCAQVKCRLTERAFLSCESSLS